MNDWRDDAKCAYSDPALFDEDADPDPVALCEGCPALEACLADAERCGAEGVVRGGKLFPVKTLPQGESSRTTFLNEYNGLVSAGRTYRQIQSHLQMETVNISRRFKRYNMERIPTKLELECRDLIAGWIESRERYTIQDLPFGVDDFEATSALAWGLRNGAVKFGKKESVFYRGDSVVVYGHPESLESESALWDVGRLNTDWMRWGQRTASVWVD